MFRITDTVKHLIIINVIMFIGTVSIGGGQLFYDLFALYFPKNPQFQPWQILTHMFMHGSVTHLLFNMIGLWTIGSPVEQALGRNKFLFLYFSAGLGAVLFQLGSYYINYIPLYNNLVTSGLADGQIIQMLSSNETLSGISQIQLQDLKEIFPIFKATMVGASGCIFGVFVAFGVLNPNAELILLFFPFPIKAKYLISGYVAYDVISGFLGSVSMFGSNIAHWAHVGGALTGFIIMWYWKKNQFNSNRLY